MKNVKYFLLEKKCFYGKIMSKYETKPTIKISMKGVMKMFLYVWFFILGTIIGSFFQLCKDRLPLGLDIIKGRSFCFECLMPLKWMDLIPIVSYFMLKGRCRYCQRRISLWCPLFETFSGCLLVFMIANEKQILKALLIYLLIMDFITLSLIDLQWQIIPDETILLEIILVILLSFYIKIPLLDRIIGMLAVSIPMILMNHCISESFGGGDIKLMIVSGYLLGWKQIVLAFIIAVLTGGLYASYLLLCKKVQRQSHMAFGGFLCFGVLISLFWGRQLLRIYGL